MSRVTTMSSGIIPAHAGSTIRHQHRKLHGRDHPRSRGEHAYRLPYRGPEPGSSPLTRGAHRCNVRGNGGRGIIPAHAGSTSSGLPVPALDRDHPRSRGEHLVAALAMERNAGSSPLTRGALPVDGGCPFGFGIIPAHAGSTVLRCRRNRNG